MNVHEATAARLKLVFEEFKNVIVSFSGGKDSGVMLNQTLEYARSIGRRIGIMHLDYEAQYTHTTEYTNLALSECADMDIYRICVPFKVSTCTSMYQDHWRPYDPDNKDIWVSKMPKGAYTAEDFPFYNSDMWDYEFQERFARWYQDRQGGGKTACLIGIRTQESFHRWKAIHASAAGYKDWEWSTEMRKDIYNIYPIYDWKTEDIWIANGAFGWSYNKLYDVFYQAGVPLNEMRVASPFLSTAQDSLKLYRIIEPNTWGKLIGRVNGVNFTGLYGGTTAMGWKNITLPAGHTWKSYLDFLLSTLPESTAERFKKKISTSVEYWINKGGEIDPEIVKTLPGKIWEGEVNPVTKRQRVRLGYMDDIESKEFRLLPTWKRCCIMVMKNDFFGKTMGFGQTKYEWDLRNNVKKGLENV